MTEINWNNFKAKFNGKEQKSFEQLCYLLFCDEFNRNIGVSRYKNQAGIETEPIQYNGKWVGFQSKFYETKIGDNKDDIKDSITKAKTKNPTLNKILFYLNQEFSESSKKNQKDPQYKIEIENHAKLKDVEIEWRGPSHFERQLTLDKNLTLAQHFFSLDKSVIDFISELNQHTESILTPIHSEINFNGNAIKIDRSVVINNLEAALNQSSLVILSGEGGVGKTAVIKDFYNTLEDDAPFFVFKATQFNISNINNLFKNYGSFTLSDFIREHQSIDTKYVVIDSAEKLADLEQQEIFQEFLSALLSNNWKIIFTTRYSYLDNLKFQFVEIYQHNFQPINIENIGIGELSKLSSIYNFNLPDNTRLIDLLQNPFYLNEYLQNYPNIDKTTSFSDFRNILWNKQISKSSYRANNFHIRREECFLRIAKIRANSGFLFVKTESCEDEILRSLEVDEIIKFDSNVGGYFITHDIYEEWALEKIVEIDFHSSRDHKSFFDSLGSSLPVRRAFRNWMSEKLRSNQTDVKVLIEGAFADDSIETHWRDEILVSVLLSDYSSVFFHLFEEKLLDKEQELFMRIIFLLRIACKELDVSILNLFGMQKIVGISLKTFFTKPKGSGWGCVIDYIFKHKKDIGLKNINIILPLLDDWNNKIKVGETTRKASLIALQVYDEISKDKYSWYGSGSEQKNILLRVILQGASEIKDGLKIIFDEISDKKQVKRRERHFELVQTILTSLNDSIEIIKYLPKEVIKLAELSWIQSKDEEDSYSRHSMEVETYFGLTEKYSFNYFPSSAFQTPVFQLLRSSPKEAIDFILSFTNKAVEHYSKSRLDNEIEEVEVFISDKDTIKQYISNRLWNMFRGTQVSTGLLESIHMALEKWLLDIAKTGSSELIKKLCLHLISNSNSASITAVVSSVVIAYPFKLFEIASILFRTKEFFIYDTARLTLDLSQKSQLLSLKNNFPSNYKNELHEEERIKACDDVHRKFSLEHIALNYQFFKSEEENDECFEKRQKVLWDIFDKYYENLPEKNKETEYDKTWRLYLARMDRRKMKPEVEKRDDGNLITFNPEIDSELKKYSEEALQKSNEPMKHSALMLWSNHKFKKEEEECKKYPQYDNDPRLVITEVKEIIKGLKKNTIENFLLFNRSIPAYACSVLVRDYFDKLNEQEKATCKEVILDYASIPLAEPNYNYQISDGVEPSIMALPELLKHFPKHNKEIKLLIFLLLINPWKQISTFAIGSILHYLWKINFDDAHSLFLGYLLLKPKYNDLEEETRNINFQRKIYQESRKQVLDIFTDKYAQEIEEIVLNKIKYERLDSFELMELNDLNTAFELLPLGTTNEEHKAFLKDIFPIFSKKIFIDDDRVDYALQLRFLEKLAYFILSMDHEEIKENINPFVDNFTDSSDMAELFHSFVSVEDRLNRYEEFWIVWGLFYDKIVEFCNRKSPYHYTKEIIYNYLLAWPYWKQDAKEWHTLKGREKLFFKKVADDIGHHPSVLYSLSKLLNDIGSNFLDDGIHWISSILQKNKNLYTDKLEVNTIYYIENIIRKYIYSYRQNIRTTKKIKDSIIVILNFLIEKGSVTGYLFREDIL